MDKTKSDNINSDSNERKSISNCPACNKENPNLVKIDSGLKLTLQKQGETFEGGEVCADCLKGLKKTASRGSVLIAKEEAQSEQKAKLWKSRILFVRHGRSMLNQKLFTEAAVAYEKYFKVLEIVFKVERNQLDPQSFQDKPKEITLISSVLWDLMLIYDSSTQLHAKQNQVGEILSKFLRFTPINNNIIRKAEKEVRKAKNPAAFRNFLKLCNAQSSRCFIATATFESRTDPSVQILCSFRDNILKESSWGRSFVYHYYRYSPRIAQYLDNSPHFKAILRPLLQGVAIAVRFTFNLPETRDS